jgi:hypothetical protein
LGHVAPRFGVTETPVSTLIDLLESVAVPVGVERLPDSLAVMFSATPVVGALFIFAVEHE